MDSILQAVLTGVLILLVGTIPRNLLFAANLRYLTQVPWAVPALAVYMWFFWRYLKGDGPPDSTRDWRKRSLRANPVSGRAWFWALLAGGLAIVALVLGLGIANRLVVLPTQDLPPSLNALPAVTVWPLLLMSAAVAGLIEESAFRGYMQGPIEERSGPFVAILITGTMFALVHLDFTLVLWPYYVAVAAIYGMVTYLTGSIWPAIVLHTSGNIYSNVDLLLHGQAEWQASASPKELVWATGIDAAFLRSAAALLVVAAAAVWAYFRLADHRNLTFPPSAEKGSV